MVLWWSCHMWNLLVRYFGFGNLITLSVQPALAASKLNQQLLINNIDYQTSICRLPNCILNLNL